MALERQYIQASFWSLACGAGACECQGVFERCVVKGYLLKYSFLRLRVFVEIDVGPPG
jgi:hypothetical protein